MANKQLSATSSSTSTGSLPILPSAQQQFVHHYDAGASLAKPLPSTSRTTSLLGPGNKSQWCAFDLFTSNLTAIRIIELLQHVGTRAVACSRPAGKMQEAMAGVAAAAEEEEEEFPKVFSSLWDAYQALNKRDPRTEALLEASEAAFRVFETPRVEPITRLLFMLALKGPKSESKIFFLRGTLLGSHGKCPRAA
ncbi:hypothetical protein L7F22_059577 [Adiantum nelumboides]|nr:hypothetical protein [Adiantum nelumboides]